MRFSRNVNVITGNIFNSKGNESLLTGPPINDNHSWVNKSDICLVKRWENHIWPEVDNSLPCMYVHDWLIVSQPWIFA